MSKQYENAGVSLSRGYDTIERIKSHVKRTKTPGVMGGIGSFGGLFDISNSTIKDPVLVSGTDGVGTKLLIAQQANRHDTIGIDLVAMCVNDIITVGATPLFFLDYIATGTINPDVMEDIVSGIATGCVESNCALIGGETAEMPDMYQEGHYDLAGFSTGIVSKEKMLDSSKIKEGDILIGLPSSGLHSNGYSLVRKILFKDHKESIKEYVPELGDTLEDTLLTPTTIYVKPVLSIIESINVHGIAHITGGGFHENIPRMLPDHLGVIIQEDSFPTPPIFPYLEQKGSIPHEEMYHIFNMGIGMVIAIDKNDVNQVMEILNNGHHKAYQIGQITSTPGVTIK